MKPRYVRSGFVFKYAVLFLIVSFMLSGCTNANDQASVPNDSSPTGEAGDKYGGTLKLAMNNSPVNLGNVMQSRTIQEVLMAGPALETLGRYDSQGNIVPWLAKSWDVDVNAKTITYHLQTGVKFHDGTDFDAEAVKWNFDQMMQAGRAEFLDIDSVEVVDAATVKVNLKNWNSSMIESIANFLWIVSPTAYEQMGPEGAAKHPVGTGPFVFEQFERDVSVTYKKFDEYWQEGKPYLDSIEWSVIPDPMIAAASFKSKDIDGYLNVPAEIARDLENSGRVLRLESGLGAFARGLITDSGDPNSPFSDVRVRKALGHAVDSQAIINSLFGDYVIPTNQWGTPMSWSYNPNVKGTPYDPEKAKQLLREAGYPNGLKTTYTTGQGTEQFATAIQGYLKEVGIEAEINIVDVATFREITGNKGSWDGIVAYNFRGDADLALYMPRNFSKDGSLYARNLAQPEDLARLLEEVKIAPDQESKQKISHELQRLVFEEHALALAIYVDSSPAVLQPHVKDTGINETYMTMFRPEDAWLEK